MSPEPIAVAAGKPILQARQPVDLVAYAEQQIRDAIVSGAFEAGYRLVETDISGQLGVSRHPIREALRRLSKEGLVTVRANRGAVVADINVMAILEVYEIRAALGFLALRHALSPHVKLPAATMRSFRSLAGQAYAAAAANDQKEMIKADLGFQAAVVDASNLSRVSSYFRSLESDIQRFNNMLKIDYDDKEGFARRHVLGLLEAIEARDFPRATAVWHDKFVTAVSRFAVLVPDAHDWTNDPRWLVFKDGLLGEAPASPEAANLRANTAPNQNRKRLQDQLKDG